MKSLLITTLLTTCLQTYAQSLPLDRHEYETTLIEYYKSKKEYLEREKKDDNIDAIFYCSENTYGEYEKLLKLKDFSNIESQMSLLKDIINKCSNHLTIYKRERKSTLYPVYLSEKRSLNIYVPFLDNAIKRKFISEFIKLKDQE